MDRHLMPTNITQVCTPTLRYLRKTGLAEPQGNTLDNKPAPGRSQLVGTLIFTIN